MPSDALYPFPYPYPRRSCDLQSAVPRVWTMTEAELQAVAIECAHLFGWRVAHFRAARTTKGWVTPVAADGKGFPDLVLVRDQLLVREMKSATGKLRPHQEFWAEAFRQAGVDFAIWRPEDWTSGRIERQLR